MNGTYVCSLDYAVNMRTANVRGGMFAINTQKGLTWIDKKISCKESKDHYAMRTHLVDPLRLL